MKTQCKTLVRLLALALSSAGASEALAATRYFDCTNGNMQTDSCWSSNIKPVAGDNAYIGYASFTSNVTAVLNTGAFAAANEYVGHSSYQGTVNHSAGSNTVSNTLYLGFLAGTSSNWGRYNLSGTGSLTTSNSVVGNSGWGTFAQSGGTHTVSSNLTLGANSGSIGIYELSGGTLTVNGSILNGAGINAFHYKGGTLNVGGGNGSIAVDSFYLGTSYTLSGTAALTTGDSMVGGIITGGAGVLTQSGGTHSSTVSVIGSSIGGSGTYNHSGGAHTATYLTVGDDVGGVGAYNLSGTGTLASQLTVVGNYGGTGSFSQASGTHTLTAGFANGLVVGTHAGGNGSYTLSGNGVLTSDWERVGYNQGTGVLTQSGGTNTVNNLLLGDNGGVSGFGGDGTYNLQGGQLIAGVIDAVTDGNATFNFTGGTLAVGTFIGNLVNNGGILAPGASPGTTVVQGDYSQGAAGALSIELGGTGAGLFDVLQVTGTATLAGDLDVMLWNGFSAVAGDSFDIVSATNLSGGFDALNLATLGAGLVWNVDYLYDQDLAGTDYVRLSVQAVPEAETYAMMLAGLGLVGWAAKRHKASHTA